jgi:hypothetical protein
MTFGDNAPLVVQRDKFYEDPEYWILKATSTRTVVVMDGDEVCSTFSVGLGEDPRDEEIARLRAEVIRLQDRQDDTLRLRCSTAEARVAQLEAALRDISTHRKQCHDYDRDVGHEPRRFDEDDVDQLERVATAALAGGLR